MVNYNPKSWITLIFSIHKSDTLRILWKPMIYLCLLTLGIAYIEINYIENVKPLEKLITIYQLIGFVISLLLVFRTNTAYDRWWEGRKKWGELVNESRNIALKLNAVLQDEKQKEFFARMLSNFAVALKGHLRKGVIVEELHLTEEERLYLSGIAHQPLGIVNSMYQRLIRLKKERGIDDAEYRALDKNINSLMEICGACERIKNTPIPFSYSLFFKKFIFIYVVTLPVAFVTTFGYYSAFIATFIFYVLVSIEVLAEEIEDPFGEDDNDLPVDTLAENISKIVYECMGLSFKQD